MQLIFVTDIGESYTLDVDPNMEMENIMALLEAESGIPVQEQSITYDGRELSQPKKSVQEVGLREHAMILLRRKVNIAGRTVEQDAEMMRFQILGNPELMNQLQQANPELINAAIHDPQRFATLLRQVRQQYEAAESQKRRETEALNADPFDLEAQRRIEDAIRQEAIMENLNHAMEYSPESFGKVIMLYIPVEVNGHPIKAFVDSGAQQTIMSPECADMCGISRLIDIRFSGIARGVGTAKILGRVHSTQIKVEDLFLPCAITVMEGREVDLLFGLDMLKAHQACIDLEHNVLRIKGREVRFLAEHELPDKAKTDHAALEDEPSQPQASTSTSAAPPPQQNFPGSGQRLGRPSQLPTQQPQTPAVGAPGGSGPPRAQFPEKDIQLIVDMGLPREEAIRALEVAGGNVDLALSMLF